jgi:hypothetical protein
MVFAILWPTTAGLVELRRVRKSSSSLTAGHGLRRILEPATRMGRNVTVWMTAIGFD